MKAITFSITFHAPRGVHAWYDAQGGDYNNPTGCLVLSILTLRFEIWRKP